MRHFIAKVVNIEILGSEEGLSEDLVEVMPVEGVSSVIAGTRKLIL